MTDSSSLTAALEARGLEVADSAIPQLGNYCSILWEWNRQINLTRHTDFDRFVNRDMRDALRLASHLAADEEVLDVGSGGGVPGIPLAIIRPDIQMSLAESVGKKSRVLQDIVDRLELSVPVYADRAENVLADERFSSLTARAVGPLWKMCHWFESHWLSAGRLLALKGPSWPAEKQEAESRGLLRGLKISVIDEYDVPGADGKSVIVEIRQA